jgi:TetR/AcrR family transcriptional regulator, cholesterol catabolism regulator
MSDVADPARARIGVTQSAPARPLTSRESVFAAAIELFGERGYYGTSMRDIARAVGILPGSLYAHIDSKEALLLEIIEKAVDRFNVAAARVDRKNLPAPAALREMIQAHLGMVSDSPELCRIVFHQWRGLSEENRVLLLDKRARYSGFYRKVIESGIADGTLQQSLNPKVAVLTILGALNWAPEWFSPTGRASASEVADQIADSLLNGLIA